MNENPTPQEKAAERLAADPGLVQRRLEADLAEAARVERTGIRLSPGLSRNGLVDALRASADSITYDHPVLAVTQAKRYHGDLPTGERSDTEELSALYQAASRTLREGELTADRRVPHGGHRILEFHRQVSEGGLFTVTLSATVRVEPDGSVWLEEHRWPSPPVRPVHGRQAGSRELFDAALRELQHDAIPLDRSLTALLLATVQGGEGTDPGYRSAVTERVTARRRELDDYAWTAHEHATSDLEDRWYTACFHRSVLENLFENHLGGAAFSLVDREDVEEIDEELRHRLSGVKGSPNAVSPGMPPHHWWWREAVG